MMSSKEVELEIFPVDYEGARRKYKLREAKQAKRRILMSILTLSVLLGSCGFVIATLVK